MEIEYIILKYIFFCFTLTLSQPLHMDIHSISIPVNRMNKKIVYASLGRDIRGGGEGGGAVVDGARAVTQKKFCHHFSCLGPNVT